MTRERWTREDWLTTIGLLVLFFPIGAAALLRWATGKRVWK